MKLLVQCVFLLRSGFLRPCLPLSFIPVCPHWTVCTRSRGKVHSRNICEFRYFQPLNLTSVLLPKCFSSFPMKIASNAPAPFSCLHTKVCLHRERSVAQLWMLRVLVKLKNARHILLFRFNINWFAEGKEQAINSFMLKVQYCLQNVSWGQKPRHRLSRHGSWSRSKAFAASIILMVGVGDYSRNRFWTDGRLSNLCNRILSRHRYWLVVISFICPMGFVPASVRIVWHERGVKRVSMDQYAWWASMFIFSRWQDHYFDF